MNLTQYLLVKLAEEAGEVAKEALKASQFGLDSTHKGNFNARYLLDELMDLAGVVTMLDQHAKTGDFLSGGALWPFSPRSNGTGFQVSGKWYKVCYYAIRSARLGLLHLTKVESDWVMGYAKLYEPGLQG